MSFRLVIVASLVIVAWRARAAYAHHCAPTVDGHVVDVATHRPIAGATVTVTSDRRTQLDAVITDETGRFEVPRTCDETLSITAYFEDSTATRDNIDASTSSIELELAAEEHETIEIAGQTPHATMNSTTRVSAAAIDRSRGKGFSESLTEVAGVAMLRSGAGMAKPIVRGQFGRRLALVIDGIRHRAQEWGIEHAPEIDPFVADTMDVERGASGVQYGSDAIGGVISVETPSPRTKAGTNGELHWVGFGNGLGASLAGRVRHKPQHTNLSLLFDASAVQTRAPNTPDYALANTGRREWSAGSTIEWRKKDFKLTASLRHYDAKLGVCACLRFDSIEDFQAALERQQPLGAELFESEFAIARPYQDVKHELAIVRAIWKTRGGGKILLHYGLQHDFRREYDTSRKSITGAQFNFRLLSNDLTATVQHRAYHLNDHWHTVGKVGVTGLAQLHQYSGLPLIPDYIGGATGVFATERILGHDHEFSIGVRYDNLFRQATFDRTDFLRLVRSGQIGETACGDASNARIQCGSAFHMVSASLGWLKQLSATTVIKGDVSTATRPPNPDEQYLNGAAPSFPVLGLGKPNVRSETTYSASVTGKYETECASAEVSAFANYIDDYIYFSPVIDGAGQPVFDVLIRGAFPRFATTSIDAVFWGGDGAVEWTPREWLRLSAGAQAVFARNRSQRGYITFVPPPQGRASATLVKRQWHNWKDLAIGATVVAVTKQTRVDRNADLAPPPPAYALVSAEVNASRRIAGHSVQFALLGENLLNQRYRDYTSLMRYFADQPGFSVSFRASMRFGS